MKLSQLKSRVHAAFAPPLRHASQRVSHVAFSAADKGGKVPANGLSQKSKRRRGRPAHLRSPYDSPLRDGNRDRLIGLLTERAAKTLLCYLMETNLNVYHWLTSFIRANPIYMNTGSWEDISGETFLRKLLSMAIEEAKFDIQRDALYDNMSTIGVDPRSIAQRIMDIRSVLAQEFIQDLQNISEENSLLLRETLQVSLSNSFEEGVNVANLGDIPEIEK